MTPRAAHAGWTVAYRETRSGRSRYEVFTSPSGQQFRRAAGPDTASVVLPMRTPGLGPLYLRPLNPFEAG